MKAILLLVVWIVCASAPAHGAEVAYAPRATSGTVGRIERLDPTLDRLLASDAKIEVLAEGFDWAEGPVWYAPGDFLLFSDVPRNVVWKWRNSASVSEAQRLHCRRKTSASRAPTASPSIPRAA
jgi:hypothetical protein